MQLAAIGPEATYMSGMHDPQCQNKILYGAIARCCLNIYPSAAYALNIEIIISLPVC